MFPRQPQYPGPRSPAFSRSSVQREPKLNHRLLGKALTSVSVSTCWTLRAPPAASFALRPVNFQLYSHINYIRSVKNREGSLSPASPILTQYTDTQARTLLINSSSSSERLRPPGSLPAPGHADCMLPDAFSKSQYSVVLFQWRRGHLHQWTGWGPVWVG